MRPTHILLAPGSQFSIRDGAYTSLTQLLPNYLRYYQSGTTIYLAKGGHYYIIYEITREVSIVLRTI